MDPTFDTGGGFEDVAIDLALQPDGRCIVAGDITEYDGVPCGSIVLVMPDGAIDSTFDTGTGFNGRVYTLDLQADGKAIAGGTFISANTASAFRLARLNTDGSLDASFTSAVNTEVRVAIVRPDGRIRGGLWRTAGGQGRLASPPPVRWTPTFSNATVLTDGSTHYI